MSTDRTGARGWAVTRPLRIRSTYLRLVFLLLGSALALAFAMIDIAVLNAVPLGSLWLIAAAAVLLGVIGLPPVLISLIPAVRVVEGSAVRSLVHAGLPETLPPARDWDTRWRAALYFLLHLLAGAVTGAGLIAAVSWTIVVAVVPFAGTTLFGGVRPGWSAAWVPLLAVPGLVAFPYLVAGLGALLARCAPPLLGPSAAERLVALQQRSERLAERNRLARELHDSVGHALTVTTVQAGAAGRVLDSDPEFVRLALAAIEETGRAALADLDHVLGLLRDQAAPRAPQPTLTDLPALLAQTRAAGVPVSATVPDDLAGVPAVVSREAYRIVQEGLTNALRHAGPVPVTLRVAVDGDHLDVRLANAITTVHSRRSGGGRGLAGMAERVALLHGTVAAAADDGTWRVAVRLPLRPVPLDGNDGAEEGR
ncbi:MAG TPA: histidine kinase [Actinocatenispora sp.]